jgi:hypothetical protein
MGGKAKARIHRDMLGGVWTQQRKLNLSGNPEVKLL